MGRKEVNWIDIDLTQVRGKWRAVVKTVAKLLTK
jgi:hypothetical protein